MLVHICCSVDSHYFLQELRKSYSQEKMIGFFYNPNIHPESEYILRLNDVKRSCEMLGIELIEGIYDDLQWFDGVKGLENEPEKGDRCVKCFDIRLEKSAKKAKELGESIFTTTLLSSPMKEQEVLYEQGDAIGKLYGLDFIKINVRKNGGVQKQNELAKKDNLYRQNYCGCKFALSKQREKQNRFSLEMISDIGGRKLPGSIEHRQEVFSKRDILEKNNIDYVLTQRKRIAWRILNGKILSNNKTIFSYILAHSESRSCKINNILWKNILIENHLKSQEPLKLTQNPRPQNLKTKTSKIPAQKLKTTQKIKIGFSQNDILFLTLSSFNSLANSDYKDILELIHNPIDYNQELQIREILCGSDSINPIVVINDEISDNICVDIRAIFQEEKVFDVLECASEI